MQVFKQTWKRLHKEDYKTQTGINFLLIYLFVYQIAGVDNVIFPLASQYKLTRSSLFLVSWFSCGQCGKCCWFISWSGSAQSGQLLDGYIPSLRETVLSWHQPELTRVSLRPFNFICLASYSAFSHFLLLQLLGCLCYSHGPLISLLPPSFFWGVVLG